jgi:hypothetical protein
MPHHVDESKMAEMQLSNMIALEKAIMEADDFLSQHLEKEDVRGYFSDFKKMDQKHLEGLRQGLTRMNVSETAPDTIAQGLIDLCKRAFMDENVHMMGKIGCYSLLVISLVQRAGLGSYYTSLTGMDEASGFLSRLTLDYGLRLQDIGTGTRKAIRDEVESHETVGASSGTSVGEHHHGHHSGA